MHDITLSELARLQSTADDTLQMNQDSFRALYERTAKSVWIYLWRRTGDSQLADDLLQETYYRFLRARVSHASEAHRRNYLFRIATNLVNDNYRSRHEHVHLPEESERGHPSASPDVDAVEQSQRRADLGRAMAKLSGRQRDALWLAYADGSSHAEIAAALGLKVGSVKLILFRARRKLAKLLTAGGRPS